MFIQTLNKTNFNSGIVNKHNASLYIERNDSNTGVRLPIPSNKKCLTIYIRESNLKTRQTKTRMIVKVLILPITNDEFKIQIHHEIVHFKKFRPRFEKILW